MADGGCYRGEEVRGYLASDDLTTPQEIKLIPINYDGSTNRTLAVGERLVIDSLFVCGGSSINTMTIFQDMAATGVLVAGEELIGFKGSANAVFSPYLNTPIICNQATATNPMKLMIVASTASASTRIFFSGRITRS
jgi:hypothetical protein